MKKIILFLFLLISVNIYSQNYVDFRANVMLLTTNEGTQMYDSNVLIRLYTDSNRVVIHSKSIQILDYEVIRTYTESDGYFNIEATATDTNYKKVLLNIAINKSINHLIVSIEYNDLGYSYSAHKIIN